MPTPVWFITATSSGFGHDLASAALAQGHHVIATARDETKIQDLKDLGATTTSFDVTAPFAEIQKVAESAVAKYGRIDYLVNAAGYILEGAVEEVDPTEAFQQFNVNVFGTTNTIRAFLPYMRGQEPLILSNGKQRRGTIATFGSLASWKGGASYAFYGMTKACMSSLAESLGAELEPFDIAVTVVEPGYFRTGFLKSGAKVEAALRIPEYEDERTPSGMVRGALAAVNGNQLGDVKKGAEVLVDVLTETGVAEGRRLPGRVVLGSDCEGAIREKCQGTLDLLDAWGGVARMTDYI
ncbi:NAD(P)-binding protein [Aspergillus californicus]